MPGEIKITPVERLADVEARLAALTRIINSGKSPNRVDPLSPRMARTQGEDPEDPNDVSYPEQIDGKGARLPIVFLDAVFDEEAEEDDDPLIWVPRSETPQAWLYSPFGWIPRLIDLRVHWQNGFYVASYVPELEVELMEGIPAGDSGTVKIVKHGAANDQEMEATLDHMAGSNSAAGGVEATIRLREGRKLWDVSNLEC